MSRTALTAALGLLVAPGAWTDAGAVCLDPATGVSGYRVPLANEVPSSFAIVVGEVMSERPIVDPTDAESIVAIIYTVHTLQILKGTVNREITLRNENDSGRYPMSKGETHLLFLSKLKGGLGAEYYADSCGNSSLLPQGNSTLQQVKALQAKGHAP